MGRLIRAAVLVAAELTVAMLTVSFLTVAVLAAVPAPAWAHSQLLATTPPDRATVTAPISEVTLTFNEPVQQRFSVVVVNGPGGVLYSHGPVRVVDTTVHQPVSPLRSGSYTVRWRVVSADSHPVEGTFGFTVALPAQGESSAGSSAPGPGPSRPAAAGAGQRPPGQQPSGQPPSGQPPSRLGLAALTVGSVIAVGSVVAIGMLTVRRVTFRRQRRERS
ncbi:copper resistance CopC family protein [Planosporangium mesophilum]|uniref:copper resistance CopC family protein n=1 Tax=Planosporangium mesophilum TaxID=689768 RepID=UPI00143C8FBD|nr:copper resistance CopC family protein [Planosporangium mesophilum]NJC86785.1 copper resistance protein CopC [Planosporangium mesophilum]